MLLQYHPGDGVGLGKDFTLYALESGIVMFKKSKYVRRVRIMLSRLLACPPSPLHASLADAAS